MSGIMPCGDVYEMYHHCPESDTGVDGKYINFEGQYCYRCETRSHKDHGTVEVRKWEQ